MAKTQSKLRVSKAASKTASKTSKRTYKTRSSVAASASVSKSKRSMSKKRLSPIVSVSSTAMSMSPVASSVAVVAPASSYILYFTEGLNRPICIVQIKNPGTWITPNLSYYRSSGLSNDRFQQKYSNTWFPCAAVLEDRAIIGGKDLESGFIFKMSSFLQEPFIGDWACQLLNTYFERKYAIEYPEYVGDILKSTASNPNPTLVKELQVKTNATMIDVYEIYQKLLEEYNDIHAFIGGYFLHDWQLVISAVAGGGYWQYNPGFREFILSSINFDRANFVLPDFDAAARVDAGGVDLAAVVAFLKNNQCYPSVELLNETAEYYRKQKISICSDKLIFKYNNVNMKLKQLYRVKELSDKYK